MKLFPFPSQSRGGYEQESNPRWRRIRIRVSVYRARAYGNVDLSTSRAFAFEPVEKSRGQST